MKTHVLHDHDLTKNPALDVGVQRFLSMMPHDAYVKTTSGRIIFDNRTANKTAATQAELLAIEQEVIERGQVQTNVSLAFVNDQGEEQHLIVDCQPWMGSGTDASVQGCITMLRDVTAEKNRQKALTESVHFLQLVLEHLPVRVFWKDNDLVYLGCNTVFANDMGHERPDQLIGTDDFNTSMTYPEAEICRTDDRFVIDNEEGRYGAEEIIGTEEEGMWIRVSKVPLYNVENEKLGVLGMYEDITEEKKAQIEVEKALHRAEELNRLKTNFVSTVSHEYRNPLASITLYVQTLQKFNDKMTAEMRLERLEKIHQEAQQMTRLMNDVLFIGHDDLSSTEPTYEAVDMEMFCEEVITSLEETLPNAVERIHTTYRGKKQPLIGSPSHLSQIISNLLTNALKYSDDQVDLTATWEERCLILTVEDKGIGIPEEARGRIFDSFFRSQNVDTVKGNGLGLFIVDRAIQLHNGMITHSSTVGQGTTFTVEIPLRPLQAGSVNNT